MVDIYKAGGIIIADKKLLVAKGKGKEFFIATGGKLKKDETAKQALTRELKEEFQVEVEEKDMESFGTYFAKAAGNESQQLQMDVFLVKSYRGEIKPDSEIEEILWIDSNIPPEIKVGSIFEQEVIPALKAAGLIA